MGKDQSVACSLLKACSKVSKGGRSSLALQHVTVLTSCFSGKYPGECCHWLVKRCKFATYNPETIVKGLPEVSMCIES